MWFLIAALLLISTPRAAAGQIPFETSTGPIPYNGQYNRGQDVVPSYDGWKANPDGTFKLRAELAKIYFESAKLDPARPTIAYCRIGERSSHTWFVLRYLLGLNDVKNYDGSWTEYGSMIGLPIERLEPQPAGA